MVHEALVLWCPLGSSNSGTEGALGVDGHSRAKTQAASITLPYTTSSFQRPPNAADIFTCQARIVRQLSGPLQQLGRRRVDGRQRLAAVGCNRRCQRLHSIGGGGAGKWRAAAMLDSALPPPAPNA